MAKKQSGFATVIDLLDSFFGGTWGPASIDSLSDDEIESLAIDIDRHYESYQLPELGTETLRCYSGGATFMQPNALFLPFARSAILYAHEVVMNCPMDEVVWRRRGFRTPGGYRTATGLIVTPSPPEWINDVGFWESNHESRKRALRLAMENLVTYEPAIRSGWIILIPRRRFWKKHEQNIWSQVRRDVRDPSYRHCISRRYEIHPAISDNVRGLGVTTSDGWDSRDQLRAEGEPIALYFNGTLAAAAEAEARFLPIADSDYRLLENKLTQAASVKRELRDSLLIHALDEVLMPRVNEESVAVIADIRRSERVFSEWRDGLAGLVSGSYLPSDMGLSEAHELVLEAVSERISSIRREIVIASSLRSRFTATPGEALNLGLAAVRWALIPDVLRQLFASLPAVLRFAAKVAHPEMSRSASVLFSLQRSKVTDAG